MTAALSSVPKYLRRLSGTALPHGVGGRRRFASLPRCLGSSRSLPRTLSRARHLSRSDGLTPTPPRRIRATFDSEQSSTPATSSLLTPALVMSLPRRLPRFFL